MNYSQDDDPLALKKQLFRYAQDLQELMKEHQELQRRHLAALHVRGSNALDSLNPFRASGSNPEYQKYVTASKTPDGEPLSLRETVKVWVVILMCTTGFAGLCILFWHRHLRS